MQAASKPAALSGSNCLQAINLAGTTGQALPPKRQANRGPRKLVGLARQGTSSRRTQRCQNSKHYGPQNALDSVLAWGDILTLTATEISNDRVPLNQTGLLCSVLVLCWVGTATASGDYRYKSASNQVLFGQHQVTIVLAALSSCITWLMFVPVALAFYASLVSHNWMPKSPFTAVAGELPAQLEVLVSSLFTIATWRGSYAALRPYI